MSVLCDPRHGDLQRLSSVIVRWSIMTADPQLGCRRVAARQRHCTTVIARFREQRQRAQLMQAFGAWQQLAWHGADRRAQMRKAVKRMAVSHQAAHFHAWRERVEQKQVNAEAGCRHYFDTVFGCWSSDLSCCC